MTDRLSIADIRANIRQRIREYELKVVGFRLIGAEGAAKQIGAKAAEAIEILAMLDRLQEGRAK